MNTVHFKNNTYKNGMYENDHSKIMAKEKARSIEPSKGQVQLRDNLYKFCMEKGIVRDSFKLGRTKKSIASNIHAFITILEKNGLKDEFFYPGRMEK